MWRHVARRTVAVSIAASFAAACFTPQARNLEAEFETLLTLTSERPTAVRTLHFSAIPGEKRVSGLKASVTVVGENGGLFSGHHPDVWVSVLNTETGVSSHGRYGNGHAAVEGWGQGVRCDGEPDREEVVVDGPLDGPWTEPAPCDTHWTVIVRWLDPQPDIEVPLDFRGHITAWGDRTQRNEPLTLDKFFVAPVEPSYDGAPAMAQATATGSVTVEPDSPPQKQGLVLRVPAELVTDEAVYPRLGRLFVRADVTDWSGKPVQLRLRTEIGDRAMEGFGGTASELEWLTLCRPGKDCELPIELTFSYWSLQRATPPPTGFISVDWVVVARLEDFSTGAAVPADLELSEAP